MDQGTIEWSEPSDWCPLRKVDRITEAAVRLKALVRGSAEEFYSRKILVLMYHLYTMTCSCLVIVVCSKAVYIFTYDRAQ